MIQLEDDLQNVVYYKRCAYHAIDIYLHLHDTGLYIKERNQDSGRDAAEEKKAKNKARKAVLKQGITDPKQQSAILQKMDSADSATSAPTAVTANGEKEGDGEGATDKKEVKVRVDEDPEGLKLTHLASVSFICFSS